MFRWSATRRALTGALVACLMVIAAAPLATGQAGAPTPVTITTPATLTPVRAVVNPSFDTAAVGPGSWTFVEALNGTQMPQIEGWQSTHPPAANFGGRDHPIEVWGSPFLGVTAVSGPTLIELNANVSSAVFQDLCLEADEAVGWEFFHHARSANVTEIVQVTITDPNNWTGATPPISPLYTSGPLSATRNEGWKNNVGTWNATHGAGSFRFAFDAIQGGQGPSYGNLLDDANVDLDALIEFMANSGVNPTSTSESTGAILALVVNGRLDSPTSFELTPTGASTIDGNDLTLGTIADGDGLPIAGAIATVAADATITVTIPAGTYWPNERSAYVQLPIDLADAVNDPDEVAAFQISSLDPDLRPGDALCDGSADVQTAFSITSALDLALQLSTPDAPAQGSDVFFTGVVSNVDGLPDPGPIEIRIEFSPAYTSLGGSGLGWSCSNNPAVVRCFYTNPLLPTESTPPLVVLTSVIGAPGSLAEATGLAIATGVETDLTNNTVVISGPVVPGLPATGIGPDNGIASGLSLILMGAALLWVAHMIDLRGTMLRKGLTVIERGSDRWRH